MADDNPAAADLLRNFEHADTLSARSMMADQFAAACVARPANEFLRDYVEHVAQVRKRAADVMSGTNAGDSTFAQFFFPGVNLFTMPVDNEPLKPGFRLNPVNCEATTEYVSVPLP